MWASRAAAVGSRESGHFTLEQEGNVPVDLRHLSESLKLLFSVLNILPGRRSQISHVIPLSIEPVELTRVVVRDGE